jgi:hypothetical protein
LDLEYENLFRMTAHIRQWAAPEFYPDQRAASSKLAP